MTLEEKAIKLVGFWYDTDFYNFKDNFDGIEDAINQAKHCIANDLDRTIEIIKQDITEIEDDDFTKQANEIIEIISTETVLKAVVKELQKDINGYLVNLQREIDNGSDVWKEKLPIIIHDEINRIFSEYIK